MIQNILTLNALKVLRSRPPNSIDVKHFCSHWSPSTTKWTPQPLHKQSKPMPTSWPLPSLSRTEWLQTCYLLLEGLIRCLVVHSFISRFMFFVLVNCLHLQPDSCHGMIWMMKDWVERVGQIVLVIAKVNLWHKDANPMVGEEAVFHSRRIERHDDCLPAVHQVRGTSFLRSRVYGEIDVKLASECGLPPSRYFPASERACPCGGGCSGKQWQAYLWRNAEKQKARCLLEPTWLR